RKWGVHFAMGGTGALVHAMAKLAESVGARFEFNANVDEILVDNGAANGVRLTDGRIFKSDIVVSNADSATTYHELLPKSVSRRWTPRRVERASHSMGLFVWCFGTKRTYDEVGQHTKVLGPRYRGLLRDIFNRKVLTDDFSLYVHRPTAMDPSLAPEGCDAFYALSCTPNLQADVDWATRAEPYRQAVEQRLSETILPGLKDQVVSSKVFTPLDFKTRLRAFNGSGFSFEPLLTQSAWFRPHNLSEGVRNLFLVGAGTHPGAGVPGVISSARVLEQVVPDVHAFA
ncbi:MAG: phytoene desaturase family protein, partial [Pseudomonadota bacterium]